MARDCSDPSTLSPDTRPSSLSSACDHSLAIPTLVTAIGAGGTVSRNLTPRVLPDEQVLLQREAKATHLRLWRLGKPSPKAREGSFVGTHRGYCQ